MSQQTVSRVERGRIGELSLRSLDAVLRELEAELDLNVRWRGGELDRVVDEGHAQLVVAAIERLEADDWTAVPEVTYLVGRDRGSIDLLAYKGSEKALLVIEVKADVTTAEGTLRRHDEKVRHGALIARTRFAWDVASVSRLLILPEASTARRRIERHASLFKRTYPLRGVGLRRWLQNPTGAVGAVLFLSATQPASDRRVLTSRRRVRPDRRRGSEHEATRRATLRRAGLIDSLG